MNITKENIDALNAIIKVEITPEDYDEKVDKQLRDYRKKANMPGFRPGNVPMPIIRKMYRTSVLVDEINKIASESLFNYIKENELEILGSPLHNEEKNGPIDWHEQKNFDFYFDIAIQPEVNINLEDLELDYYNLKFDDEFINKQVDAYRKNFGNQTSPEISSIEDRLFGKFEELDEAGNVKEDGISHSASVLSQFTENNEALIGLKKGDTVKVNIKELFKDNQTEIAAVLGIDKNKVAEIGNDFNFTLEEIHGIELAEMNEEFYKKAFPHLEIKTADEFKAEIVNEISKQTVVETDKRFSVDVQRKLIEQANLELPKEFLKRWLLSNNDNNKELTKEDIDKDFDKYAEAMKWQIIENKILSVHDLKVEKSDVKEYIKSWFSSSGQESTPEMEEQADKIVENILKNKQESQRIYDKLYNDKLLALFKEKIKTTVKEISLDDFIKLA